MKARKYLYFIIIFSLLQLCCHARVIAGSPRQTVRDSGILRGQVTDPSGAAIANANVVLTPAAAPQRRSKRNPTDRASTNSRA